MDGGLGFLAVSECLDICPHFGGSGPEGKAVLLPDGLKGYSGGEQGSVCNWSVDTASGSEPLPAVAGEQRRGHQGASVNHLCSSPVALPLGMECGLG